MVPLWLHHVSIFALVTGAACAAIIVTDEIRHPQKMGVMNIVWPVSALFGGLLWLGGYLRYARQAGHEHRPPSPPAFAISVAKASSHCGGGCVLGDLAAEWLAFAVPGVAIWFGWQSLFAEKMYAVWVLDFVFAFLFGIAFQYFTIAPMRSLTVARGLLAAIKADALSLTAWQIGMYGCMAIGKFWVFGVLLGSDLQVNSVEFWFLMQLAMLAGFCTAYPVNWWLLRTGIKESM